MQQKITTHLWFDTQAKQAAELYIATFPNSKIKKTTVLNNTPSGTVDILTIELTGQEFTLLNAGPLFKFNPSVSFLVACDTKEEVNAMWEKLSAGGQVLMELAEYPFSTWYGWTTDAFGLSWQIMLRGEMTYTQKITPTMLFVGDVCGKAEAAIHFYASIFHNSRIGDIARYEADEKPDQPGTLKHADFILEEQGLAAMDSARMHDFQFNEAISFIVHCETQAEIDYYWEKLSAVPESEQCGWLKDKYGFSWQIVPNAMDAMMAENDPEKIARVTEAFLKMKKFNIAELQKAYENN